MAADRALASSLWPLAPRRDARSAYNDNLAGCVYECLATECNLFIKCSDDIKLTLAAEV